MQPSATPSRLVQTIESPHVTIGQPDRSHKGTRSRWNQSFILRAGRPAGWKRSPDRQLRTSSDPATLPQSISPHSLSLYARSWGRLTISHRSRPPRGGTRTSPGTGSSNRYSTFFARVFDGAIRIQSNERTTSTPGSDALPDPRREWTRSRISSVWWASMRRKSPRTRSRAARSRRRETALGKLRKRSQGSTTESG